MKWNTNITICVLFDTAYWHACDIRAEEEIRVDGEYNVCGPIDIIMDNQVISRIYDVTESIINLL